MIKKNIITGIEHINHIFDNFLLKKLNPKINNTIICIEECTIGDILLTLPYYFNLKNENIVVICDKNITLFKYFLPEIKAVQVNIELFLRNPLYRYKKWKDISCDKKIPEKILIVHPHSRRQIRFLKLAKNLPAKEKIIYYGKKSIIDKSQSSFDKYFTSIIQNPFINSKINVHTSNHIKIIFENVFNRAFNITKDDYISFYRRFTKKIPAFSDYIVILTDASTSMRKYPESYWQIILNNLPQKTSIIKLGKNSLNLKHPNLIDLSNKTTILEAINFIQNAKLVIGNETGLTHLAYMSGVPTICIIAGGSFGSYLPWHEFKDIVDCVYKPLPCFNCIWKCKYLNNKDETSPPCLDIAPEQVLKSVEKMNDKYNVLNSGK